MTTTKGWELLVSWKDQTMSWVKLKDLKDRNPVEVSEYAQGNDLVNDPAFRWWVPYVLRKRERILDKVKTKYWERSHKFGIRLPKSVKESLRFDKGDGMTLCRDAIEKEMSVVKVEFEFIDGVVIPVGYKRIRIHWIFDIKMSNLQRKDLLVANGNETEPPKDTTFSSVVSRESVRIFFLLEELNNVNILSADIQNSYLFSNTNEKIWTVADAAFGSNVGRPVKIVRALYGLKTRSAIFRGKKYRQR